MKFLIACTAFVLLASIAHAQTFPDRPIRLVVTVPPGGAADLVARTVSDELGRQLNTQIVVENRAGASGTIASSHVAKSAPDGYSMMLTADGVPANPHLFKNLNYDIFRDLMPVSLVIATGIGTPGSRRA